MAEDPLYGIRMTACNSALASVLRMLANGLGDSDGRNEMVVVCSIYLGAFGLNVKGVEGVVDRNISRLESRDVVIHGILIGGGRKGMDL